jgi:putative NADPH-quinone reductase
MAADHLVWIFPVWWGGPAITKGFIDRVFLPSMAFSYEDKSNRIRGHLQNKTARIVTTLDQSGWTLNGILRAYTRQLKQATLQFCGIKKSKRITWVRSVVQVLLREKNGYSIL